MISAKLGVVKRHESETQRNAGLRRRVGSQEPLVCCIGESEGLARVLWMR